ncbi:MAG: protein kinase [Geminicoccaceae bacterium]|nr:protein kinase [Geminicoccaceae bacterium]
MLDVLLDTPPERRSALFAEVSGGDPDRRAELERLVAECERAYPLLDQPASDRFASLIHTAPLRAAQVVAERYQIVRELGHGGMATVYLAQDLKHMREVALKVVRSELVNVLGGGRFLREIDIAAQLRHPHIVPLYDSGESDGIVYYVMPYESGQSLRDRLRRDGKLPIDDAVVIIRDVCDALAYAHARGVVHRDIKPDNVLLSGRNALVTDFGVARAATAVTGAATSTGAGVVIGTPTYMAPEQVAADPGVDHRADIYAVGVLAYELLAGRPPFEGEAAQDVLAAQLARAPVPLSEHRSDVPPALEAIVMRCLEKRPADRWQRATAIVQALDALHGQVADTSLHPATIAVATSSAATQTLGARGGERARRLRRRWFVAGAVTLAAGGAVSLVHVTGRGTPASADAGRSSVVIGVLPVRAASPGGSLDWLAEGLQRQLPIELTPVAGLEVRPTETIVASLGLNWPLDSIALVRGVDYFVRATLSTGGSDSVLASLELIEGGIRSVRVGSVRVPQGGTAATVEGVGRRLAEQLRPMLGSRVREREAESRTASAAAVQLRRRAWQHRLRARERLLKGELAEAERALDSASALLRESERADPRWREPRLERAGLTATLALVALQRAGGTDLTMARRHFDMGLTLIDSMLERAPGDPVVIAARGRLQWQRTTLVARDPAERRRTMAAAQSDLEKAIALDTALASATADLSQVFESAGQYEEAATLAERANRLDSYMEESSQIINRLAISNLEIGRDAAAADWCARGRRRFPNNPAHWACVLDVMAWGAARPDPDSAWMAHRAARRLTAPQNVTALIIYDLTMAAVLARSPGVPADSARAVFARVDSVLDVRDGDATPYQNAMRAAVLYRLGDSTPADSLVDWLRTDHPAQAARLTARRMLRSYVKPTAAPPSR